MLSNLTSNGLPVGVPVTRTGVDAPTARVPSDTSSFTPVLPGPTGAADQVSTPGPALNTVRVVSTEPLHGYDPVIGVTMSGSGGGGGGGGGGGTRVAVCARAVEVAASDS